MAAPQLRGALHLPADKSIAHRALLFTAMGRGTATVTVHQPGEDVISTAAALATLGALEEPPGADGAHLYRVTGGATTHAALPGTEPVTLDCGNSGTIMRLLAGAATTRAGATVLVGDESLSGRPMERVAEPLRSTGAHITTTNGHAPIYIEGAPVRADTHTLKVSSAQVLGALTIASLAAPGTTEVSTPGPTRDHTERMLAWLGVEIAREGTVTTLSGPAIWDNRDIVVPGDPSAAAFWLVAGSIHPDAEIRLLNVGLNPTRIGVIRILQRMGAQIDIHPAGIEGPEPSGDLVVRSSGPLRAIDLEGDDVADAIDELPVLAVAMAAADGTSTVRGAEELRVKESDRIALTVAGLRSIGVTATELHDGWEIVGRPIRAVAPQDPSAPRPTIRTAGDHRIAMAFAIADATGVGAATLDDPGCADVSYPGFFEHLAALASPSNRAEPASSPGGGDR